ncbi:MAG: glycosyltransferase [Acidobacteriota bacterium]
MPKLSIIVPVRDHAAELELCLQAIRASAQGHDEVEVLVVDTGSTDGSLEVARQAGIEVVDAGRVTAAAARNAGARRAQGDLLAFVDADIVIAPSWVAVALSALEVMDIAATGTRPFAPQDANWVQNTVGLMRSHPESCRPARWLSSCNCVIRREVFERVGGFDPSYTTCEDTELSFRLRRQGFRLLDEPRLACVHLGDPRTLRGVFLSELWRGRDNLRVTVQPGELRDKISGLVPVIELAAMAACLAPAPRVRRSAAAFVIGMIGLRAWRMLSGGASRWRQAPGALLVAGAYELSRALAVALPAPYRVRQRSRP